MAKVMVGEAARAEAAAAPALMADSVGALVWAGLVALVAREAEVLLEVGQAVVAIAVVAAVV